MRAPVQEDMQASAAAAAAAVQAELTSAERAADATPVDALRACSMLRAALAEYTTELQRWAVSLKVESVRQGSASKRLLEREDAALAVRERESALAEQQAAVSRTEADLQAMQVSTCHPPHAHDVFGAGAPKRCSGSWFPCTGCLHLVVPWLYNMTVSVIQSMCHVVGGDQ